MRKTICILCMVLLWSLTLVACSKPQAQETSSAGEAPIVATPKAETDKAESVKNEPLTGKALIDSLKIVPKKTLYIKGVTQSDGQSFSSVTYLDGENMRYESEIMGMTQVMIYNAEEGITYVYTLGEAVGFMYKDDEEDIEDYDEDDDLQMEIPFGEAIFEGVDDYLIAAEKTIYKGYDAIYYETSITTPEGTFTTKQWIAIDYWHPLKMESYQNDVLLSAYEAIELSDKLPGGSKLFQAPDDVEFMNFDAMFDFQAP